MGFVLFRMDIRPSSVELELCCSGLHIGFIVGNGFLMCENKSLVLEDGFVLSFQMSDEPKQCRERSENSFVVHPTKLFPLLFPRFPKKLGLSLNKGYLMLFISIVCVSFRVASVTLSVIVPAVFVLRTTTTSCPPKSFICGWVNGSSDVASPLHAA